MSLAGKTVVVTGGTGFLGSGVCALLLELGAKVHVTWKHQEELDRFDLTDRCTMHEVELTDEASVRACYEGIETLWGSVHLAGGFEMSAITDTSLEAMESMFQMNVVTAFLCSRESVRAMRRSGGGGRIVNVGARTSVEPAGGMLPYTTAKAGVTSLTQCLAKEVLEEGILVNAVLPSIMDTARNRADMPDADFAQWPKVEEVAAAIHFLLSPENRLTTGTLLPVYGRA